MSFLSAAENINRAAYVSVACYRLHTEQLVCGLECRPVPGGCFVSAWFYLVMCRSRDRREEHVRLMTHHCLVCAAS